MTACLSICREATRTGVTVDHPTESQVAASDSLAFPKAVSPGASRASGFSKFFENVKPLSDFFGAILDVAGRGIGKLFGFDKLVNFNDLIDCEDFLDWGMSLGGQEKAGSKSAEHYLAPACFHSQLEIPKVIHLLDDMCSQEVKNQALSNEAGASSSFRVEKSLNSNLQEQYKGVFFNAPGHRDIRYFERRLTSEKWSFPASKHYAPSSYSEEANSFKVQDRKNSALQEQCEDTLFIGTNDDDMKYFEERLR